MVDENNIDKLFKSALEPLNVPPPPAIKNSIDAALEKERVILANKKSQKLKLLAAILAIALLSVVSYSLLNNRDDENKIINAQTNGQTETNKKENSTSEENYVDKNNHDDENVNLTADNNEKIVLDNSFTKSNKSIPLIISKEENPVTISNSEQSKIIYLPSPAIDANLSSLTKLPDQISTISNDLPFSMVGKSSPVSLFVYYQPNYSYCLLVDNTPDVTDDVQMYKDREKPEFSYSTGFNLRYNLSKNWGFSAGVSYSTVIKSISLLTLYADGTDENMYYAYSTSSGLIEVPHPENVQIQAGDSLRLSREGEKILKFVNVPLMARYVIPKQNLNWFFNGGISFNFLVQDQARIATANAEEIVNNKTQGLKKISYGFIVGAGLEYKLNNNLNLIAEPVYRGTFTSITEGAAVKNYPYSLGINLGASINF